MIFKDCCYNFQIEIGIGMMYSLFSSMYRRSIQDHPELPLNPSQFSSNVNVSWKIVKNNPHNQWNFSRLSTVDNNISWNDILANLDQNFMSSILILSYIYFTFDIFNSVALY